MQTPKFIKETSEILDNSFVQELESLGAEVKKDSHELGAYITTFRFNEAVTVVKFILHDRQTGADLVITNMTTLPDEQKGKGWGSRAIQTILRWAEANNLTDIQAVQVQDESESFWNKNGFTKNPEQNPISIFTYQK